MKIDLANRKMNMLHELAVEVRVRYCECDPMNVAHHSVFPVWLEIARTELLRRQGTAYADLETSGVFFVVTELAVRYRRPARYDDLLRVLVRQRPYEGRKHVKVHHDYEIHCGQTLIATASTTLACVGRDGRPMAIPDGVMEG